MIKTVSIDTDLITNWDDFHDIFSKAFGFPDFYGRNMNAWIDCMSSLDDKDSGLTTYFIDKNDTLVIELRNSESFKKNCTDIYFELFECIAFVNERCLAAPGPMIAIANA